MFEAATQVAVLITKWSIRIGFIAAGITAFIILLNLGLSLVFVQLNGNVLSDLFGFIQLWLPFNLNTLLAWLMTATVAWIVYRLAVIAIAYVDVLISD